MKRLIYILPLMLFVVNCRKPAPEPETAVLTNRMCALIDLFMDNTKIWRKGDEQLSLTGWKDKEKKGYFYLNICADDTTFFKPYGDCKGVVHVKGNRILLFGDSWNDCFWSSDTTFHISDINQPTGDEFVFYDPIEWTICVREDTSLCEAYSSLPWDNLTLLDSIFLSFFEMKICKSKQGSKLKLKNKI